MEYNRRGDRDENGRARTTGGMMAAAWWRRRGGGGVVVVAWWGQMVRDKSKTNYTLRLMVLFNVHSNLFCTVYTFAPIPDVLAVGIMWGGCGGVGGVVGGVGGVVGGAGGVVGGNAGGRYPPLMIYIWDDKGF